MDCFTTLNLVQHVDTNMAQTLQQQVVTKIVFIYLSANKVVRSENKLQVKFWSLRSFQWNSH